MRFVLIVRNEKTGNTWRESYDKPVGRSYEEWSKYHPANRLRGRSLKAVREWGMALVDWYNATLRPGETRRVFVSAELEE